MENNKDECIIKISKEIWKNLINDNNVFKEKDKKLLWKIYKSKGKAIVNDLAEYNSENLYSYNFPIVSLSKRIKNVLLLENNKDIQWWRVLFSHQIRENNKFCWILKKELIEAIKELSEEDEINNF